MTRPPHAAGMPQIAHRGSSWRALATCPTDTLREAALEMVLGLRAFALRHGREVAKLSGLPEGEIVASPLGFRASLMAVSEGVVSVHHDLRVGTSWHRDLLGDEVVRDAEHGVWEAGRLGSGKYESFLQDEPLVVFNPNNSARWTPHEFLHRTLRFVYAPGLSRRSLYLGARLNEVLPVAHWYGWDQFLRTDGTRFSRERLGTETQPTWEDAVWLTLDEESLRERIDQDLEFLRLGARHLVTELEAIDEELSSGHRVEVSHPFLDASGDALAYVVGHRRRLVHPATELWISSLLEPGRDYDARPEEARARVECEAARLIDEDLVWDPERARARSTGRVLWDWFLRASLAHPMRSSGWARLLPSAKVALDEAWQGEPVDLDAWREKLLEGLPASLGPSVVASGFVGVGPRLEGPQQVALPLEVSADASHRLSRVQRDQLVDGFQSCLPATWNALVEEGLALDVMDAFVRQAGDTPSGEAFFLRQSLAHRFARFADSHPMPATLRTLLRFEVVLLEVRERDDTVERLGAPVEELPDPIRDGWLVGSRAFRVFRASFDVVRMHGELLGMASDEDPAAGVGAWLVGMQAAGLSVVPLPAALDVLWLALVEQPSVEALPWLDRLQDALDNEPPPPGLPQAADEWLCELTLAGAIAWVAP